MNKPRNEHTNADTKAHAKAHTPAQTNQPTNQPATHTRNQPTSQPTRPPVTHTHAQRPSRRRPAGSAPARASSTIVTVPRASLSSPRVVGRTRVPSFCSFIGVLHAWLVVNTADRLVLRWCRGVCPFVCAFVSACVLSWVEICREK